MDIEGLTSKVTVKEAHRSVTVFYPEGSDARAVIALEMLSSGKSRVMLFEDGKSPETDEVHQLYIEVSNSGLVDRMIRAMAILHFGVAAAENAFTDLDVEMLSRGFELGFTDDESPVWIRVSSSMNVVVQKRDKNGLPTRKSDPVAMLCIIPERTQLQFNCENIETAFSTLEKDTPFKTRQDGNPDEMISMDIIDANTLVYH